MLIAAGKPIHPEVIDEKSSVKNVDFTEVTEPDPHVCKEFPCPVCNKTRESNHIMLGMISPSFSSSDRLLNSPY